MRFSIRLAAGLLLASGLALGATAVHAARGVSIVKSQAAAVRVGMTATEVEQILGRPAEAAKFRNMSGPTWTYLLVGAVFADTEFDVEFGTDGRVASAREFVRRKG
jgi:outer membrane protein assembly factor BamE (lipoprotein component of BamABCDE complex)